MLVQKELKNIYIGEYPGRWQPWANTLAYYNFNWNLNDSSGNNNNASVARGSAVYYTVDWENQAITCSGNVIKSGVQQQNILTANHTLAFWVYLLNTQSIDIRVMGALWASGSITHMWIWTWWSDVHIKSLYFRQPNKTWNYTSFPYVFTTTTWYNVILTIDSSLGCSCYINWVKVWNTETIVDSWTSDFYFWNNYQLTDSGRLDGYLDDIIIENGVRTAQEVADYYNQTKSNYWIS